ncbi:MAG: hypothetical protein CVT63_00280 [Candidatus Anoxymicrobium japonicum]|uniref:Probable endolytic peptidoglycan transglycosylase RlpA n=1 Tax=Candidatus Anoxymicrobium japonicum TaxID=2013648 RepID=A0A2N3G895_9ACTN|nr:MAG: hypothetical protein CVT63_00280 [Candidatus Anoxymicrobium japonicum]
MIIVGSVFLMSASVALAQTPAQESLMTQEERSRSIEREIASLESELSRTQQDAISIAHKLSDIEKQVLNCYLEIDRAESAISDTRRKINNKLRAMYIGGRKDILAQLMKSRDALEFLVCYDYMMKTISKDADAFARFKKERDHLQKCQDRLLAFKKEEARLARTADAAVIEARIQQKKNELAQVTSQLISQQLPGTYAPAPANFDPARVYVRPDENGFTRTGQVISGYSSWYGGEFHGRPTSSGEVFDQFAFTCAHKTLPFGTWLRVTFRGRNVVVKVNDRGPFIKGRMLDLSRGAAEAIGLTGVQWVDCEIVVPGN